MEVLLNIVYVILGGTLLYAGAELLIRGGVFLAEKCRISPLIIGLTLVAFATSAPELVVSLVSAFSGNVDISLGNVTGSNICNIALILGLSACVRPLKVQKHLLKLDAPLMVGASILLALFFFFNRGVTFWQGAIFFTLLILYTLYNIFSAGKNKSSANTALPGTTQGTIQGTTQKTKKQYSIPGAIFLTAAGLGMLVGGAELFLAGAKFIARLFHLSDAVIGLTVAAVGTSLPELATSLIAAAKGETDIAIGNVIGSNIFNILGILGICPMICPLVNSQLSRVDLCVMLLCGIILLPMMWTKSRISRYEGAFLLLIYISYISFLFMLQP